MYREIINHYKKDHQQIKLLEELSEAAASIARYINEPSAINLYSAKEELVDTLSLIEQFFIIHNIKKSEIYLIQETKNERTLQRIKEENDAS